MASMHRVYVHPVSGGRLVPAPALLPSRGVSSNLSFHFVFSLLWLLLFSSRRKMEKVFHPRLLQSVLLRHFGRPPEGRTCAICCFSLLFFRCFSALSLLRAAATAFFVSLMDLTPAFPPLACFLLSCSSLSRPFLVCSSRSSLLRRPPSPPPRKATRSSRVSGLMTGPRLLLVFLGFSIFLSSNAEGRNCRIVSLSALDHPASLHPTAASAVSLYDDSLFHESKGAVLPPSRASSLPSIFSFPPFPPAPSSLRKSEAAAPRRARLWPQERQAESGSPRKETKYSRGFFGSRSQATRTWKHQNCMLFATVHTAQCGQLSATGGDAAAVSAHGDCPSELQPPREGQEKDAEWIRHSSRASQSGVRPPELRQHEAFAARPRRGFCFLFSGVSKCLFAPSTTLNSGGCLEARICDRTYSSWLGSPAIYRTASSVFSRSLQPLAVSSSRLSGSFRSPASRLGLPSQVESSAAADHREAFASLCPSLAASAGIAIPSSASRSPLASTSTASGTPFLSRFRLGLRDSRSPSFFLSNGGQRSSPLSSAFASASGSASSAAAPAALPAALPSFPDRSLLLSLLSDLENAAATAATAATATVPILLSRRRISPAPTVSCGAVEQGDTPDRKPLSPQQLLKALAGLAWATLQHGEASLLDEKATDTTEETERLDAFHRRLDRLLKRLLSLEHYTASAAAASPRPRSETSAADGDGQAGGGEEVGAAKKDAGTPQEAQGKVGKLESKAARKGDVLIGGPVSVYVEYVLFLLPLWKQRRQLLERVEACRVQGGTEGASRALAAVRDLHSLLRMLRELQELTRLRRLFVTYLGMVQRGPVGWRHPREQAETPGAETTLGAAEAKERNSQRNEEDRPAGKEHRVDEAGTETGEGGSGILEEVRAIVEEGRCLLREWGHDEKDLKAATPELEQNAEERRPRGTCGASSEEKQKESQFASLSLQSLLQPAPALAPSQLRRLAQNLLALGVRTAQVEREIESLRPFSNVNFSFFALEGEERQPLSAEVPSESVTEASVQNIELMDSSSTPSFPVLASLPDKPEMASNNDTFVASSSSPPLPPSSPSSSSSPSPVSSLQSRFRFLSVGGAPRDSSAEERELQVALLRGYAREGLWREALKKLSLLVRFFASEFQEDEANGTRFALDQRGIGQQTLAQDLRTDRASWERSLYLSAATVAEACAEKEQYVAAAEALAVLPSSLRPPTVDLLLPASSSFSSSTPALFPLMPPPLVSLSLSLAHALQDRLRSLQFYRCSSSSPPSSSPLPSPSLSSLASASSSSSLVHASTAVPSEVVGGQHGDRDERVESSASALACSPQTARLARTFLDALTFLVLRLRLWTGIARRQNLTRREALEEAAVAAGEGHSGALRLDKRERGPAGESAGAGEAVEQQGTADGEAVLTREEDEHKPRGSPDSASNVFLTDAEKALTALAAFLSTAQKRVSSLSQVAVNMQQEEKDKDEGDKDEGEDGGQSDRMCGEGEDPGLGAGGTLDAAVGRLANYLEEETREREKTLAFLGAPRHPRAILRSLRQARDADELPQLIHALVQREDAATEATKPRSKVQTQKRLLSPLQIQFALLEALRLLHERSETEDHDGSSREDEDGDRMRRRRTRLESILKSVDALLLALLPSYASASSAHSEETPPQALGVSSPALRTTLGLTSTAISLASSGEFPRLRRFLTSLPLLPFELSRLLSPPAQPAFPRPAVGLSPDGRRSAEEPLHLFPFLAALQMLLMRVAEARKTPDDSLPAGDAFLAFAYSLVRETPELLNLPPHMQTYLPASLAFFLAHVRHSLKERQPDSSKISSSPRTPSSPSSPASFSFASPFALESSPALTASLNAVAEMERREPERVKEEIEAAMKKTSRERVFAKTLELIVSVRWQTMRLLEQLTKEKSARRQTGAERDELRRSRSKDETYVGRVLARERRRVVSMYGQLLRAFQNDGTFPLCLSELVFSELRICDMTSQRRHLPSSPDLSPHSPLSASSPSSASSPPPQSLASSDSRSHASSAPSFLSRAYVAALRSYSAFAAAADSFASVPEGRNEGTFAAETAAQAAVELLDLMESAGVDLHAGAFAAALKATSKRASPSFFPAFFFSRDSSPLLEALLLIRRMTTSRVCLPDVRCFNYALAVAARQTYLPSSLPSLSSSLSPSSSSYSVSSALLPSFSSRGLGSGEAATNGDRGETEEETGSLAFGRGEEGAVAAEWLLREMTKHGDVGPNAVTLTTTLEAFRKAGMHPSPLLQSLLPEEPGLAESALKLLAGESSVSSSPPSLSPRSPPSLSPRFPLDVETPTSAENREDGSLSPLLSQKAAKVRVVDTPLLNALLHCQAVRGDVETAERLFVSHLKSLQMFHLGRNAFDRRVAALGRPDETSFQALLFAANKAGNPSKAEQFLRLQVMYRLPPRIQQWNEVLKAYVARFRALSEGRASPVKSEESQDLCDLFRIYIPGEDGEAERTAENERVEEKRTARSEAEELCESVDRVWSIFTTLKTQGPSPDVRTFLLVNRALSSAAAAVEAAFLKRVSDGGNEGDRGDSKPRRELAPGVSREKSSEETSCSSSPSQLLSRIAEAARRAAQAYSDFVSSSELSEARRKSACGSPAACAPPPDACQFKPWIFGEAMKCANFSGSFSDAIHIFLDELLPLRKKIRKSVSGGLAQGTPAGRGGAETSGAHRRRLTVERASVKGGDPPLEDKERASGNEDQSGGDFEASSEAQQLLPLPVSVGQVLIHSLEGLANERLEIVREDAKKRREKEQVLKELGVPVGEQTQKEIQREKTIQSLTALMQRGLAALRREWPKLAPTLEETLWGVEETPAADRAAAREDGGRRKHGSGEVDATVDRLLGNARSGTGASAEKVPTGDRILLSRLPAGLFNMAHERGRNERNRQERKTIGSVDLENTEQSSSAGTRSGDGEISEATAMQWRAQNVSLSPGIAIKRELIQQLRKATTFEEAYSVVHRLWRLRSSQPGLAFGPGDEAVVFRSFIRHAPRPSEALRVFRSLQESVQADSPTPASGYLLPSSSSFLAALSSSPSSPSTPFSPPSSLPLGLLQEAFLAALRESREGEAERLLEVLPFFVEAPYPPQALLSPSRALEALKLLGGPVVGEGGDAGPRSTESERKRDTQAIFAFVQKWKQAVRGKDEERLERGQIVSGEDLEEAAMKALGERGGWRESVALLHERLTSSASPAPLAWWTAAQQAAMRAKKEEVARVLERLTRVKFAVAAPEKPPSLLAKVKRMLAEAMEEDEARRREEELLESARRRELGAEIAYAVEDKDEQAKVSGTRLRRGETSKNAKKRKKTAEEEMERIDEELSIQLFTSWRNS
ncbi:putative transmembrane protein [Toxoplasma gondii MAS]|uniref:Putative transmembrane protein n=1 Tax=Toxoplasma gondii MAS TaxID=943118 RepID=A0A086Q7T0_TOXGO|nr:putative transmembrane protein [Toxoplasma gondii MAS]